MLLLLIHPPPPTSDDLSYRLPPSLLLPCHLPLLRHYVVTACCLPLLPLSLAAICFCFRRHYAIAHAAAAAADARAMFIACAMLFCYAEVCHIIRAIALLLRIYRLVDADYADSAVLQTRERESRDAPCAICLRCC